MKNYTTLLLALAIALPAAAQDTHKTSAYGYFGAGTAYGKIGVVSSIERRN